MKRSKWMIRECGLRERDLLKNEAVYSTSNGYIGVRANFEEGYKGLSNTIRGAYINGCYDISTIIYDEKLYGFPENKQIIVNLHDFQTIRLFFEDELFDLSTGTIVSYNRTLDMERGVCERSVEWESPKGKRLSVQITRMTSFEIKELFTIDYIVTPLNCGGEIRFISEGCADAVNYSDGDDPRTNSRPERNLRFITSEAEEGILYLESETVHSKISIATSLCHTLSKEGKFEYMIDGMTARVNIKTEAVCGEQIRLVKYAHCLDGQGCKDVRSKAFSMARLNKGTVDALYQQQRVYLDKRWSTADVLIDSDDGSDLSLRYCIYQLICQSAFISGSIPAKGLSGEGYEGHYFWDTEIFIQPFFMLTDPDAAKKLLLYRHQTLGAAKENAKVLGHKKGAAYPWRTITGSECSSYFPAGSAQYHINADIAYAAISYYLISGDEELLLREGAEIIFETARLWTELGHYHKGTFRIDAVTGPDEYTCLINNNYYTNILAQYNIRWAVKIYDWIKEKKSFDVIEKIGLKQSEVEDFIRAYKCMYLPCDEERGITPQDDSFLSKKRWDFDNTSDFPLLLHHHPMQLYRHQICKQADVLLAYYLFQKQHDRQLMKRSYEYYEDITTHDSSLSACIFSIMAARLGDTVKSYGYFRRTLMLDIDDTHQNTKDGLHMANLAGAYLCVIGGFAGFVIDEEGVALAPVLPNKWRSYCFRFVYRRSVFNVTVNQNGTAISRIKGDPQAITLNGEEKLY